MTLIDGAIFRDWTNLGGRKARRAWLICSANTAHRLILILVVDLKAKSAGCVVT